MSKIRKHLDYLDEQLQSYAATLVDDEFRSFGFFVHCTLPDIFHQIEKDIEPWYVSFWSKVNHKLRCFLGLYDDEIPF